MVANPSSNFGMMFRLQTESYYRCLIFASSDAADSTKWPKLSVSYTTTFITAGGATSVCQGDSVTLSVSKTDPSYIYQWQRNGGGILGANLSYYPAKTAGNYACVVTDSCGSTTSNFIAVAIAPAPTAVITANGSTVICKGNTVTLTADTATGYTYQWQKNAGNITGATASVYAADTSANFTCIVTNNCGSKTSNIITVTLAGTIPSAVITAGGSLHICAGHFVTLTADTGAGRLYQWQLNGVAITGAVSSSYAASVAGDYTCIVSNICGGKTSNVLTVTVVGGNTLILQPNATIGMDALVSSHPANVNTNLGAITDFNAEAWTYGGTPGISRSFIRFDLTSIPANASIQQATFTLYNNPTSGNNNGNHSNLSGSDASWLQKVTASWNENTITWNNQPGTTTLGEVVVPQSTSNHEDYNLVITGLVQDMVTNPSSNFGMMIRLQNENYYRCLIFGSSDNADSTKWPKLTINYSVPIVPSITASGDTSICPGDSVTLNVSKTDPSYSYQWQWNGGIISGASSSSYAAQSAGNYTCIVNDSCGSATSNIIPVTVIPPPLAVITSGTSTLCKGSSVLLNANTGTGLTYQWQKNGVNIPGATSSTYSADTASIYTCVVSNPVCAGLSTTSNQIVISPPGINTMLVLQPNAANGTDAMVSSYFSSVNTNYGTTDGFDAYEWTAGGTPFLERSFIRFDVSAVPINASVSQAILTLYHSSTAIHGGQHSNLTGSDASWIQKVTAAWNENTITWNNQPASTTTNQVTVPQSTSANQDYNLDVTNLVQDMVANPSSNFGMVMRLQTEAYYRALIFASSDDADSTKLPKLTIS